MTQENAVSPVREADAPLETVERAEAARDRRASLNVCAVRVVQAALDNALETRRVQIGSDKETGQEAAAELGSFARAAYDAFMGGVSLGGSGGEVPTPHPDSVESSVNQTAADYQGFAEAARESPPSSTGMRISYGTNGEVVMTVGAKARHRYLVLRDGGAFGSVNCWEISEGKSRLLPSEEVLQRSASNESLVRLFGGQNPEGSTA